MRLLYFAWVRTRIGVAEEEIAPPPEVRDVAALLSWLRGRGPGYAAALAEDGVIQVAVNQIHARAHDPVGPDDEVAVFPPVTGG